MIHKVQCSRSRHRIIKTAAATDNTEHNKIKSETDITQSHSPVFLRHKTQIALEYTDDDLPIFINTSAEHSMGVRWFSNFALGELQVQRVFQSPSL
jgi:hypothetical protein